NLDVKRMDDRISISFDTDSLEEIELEIGYKMVTGFRREIFVISDGEKASYGFGLGTSASFGTRFLSRQLHGIPMNKEKYVVEVRLTIFETDIPSQHMWNPKSDKYKELWTNTLRSSEI
ncbi:unnamed protein product, partial [marine sediment metagenome]